MDLKDILAISGQPGLYKFISQGRNAMIVENLETKKRMSAFGSERISYLEDISIFTDDEDLPLIDVFKKIHEKEGENPAVDPKSPPETLKSYLSELVPGYDKDRVYTSDIKKIMMWYNLLLKLDMVKFDEKDEKDEKDQTEEKGSEKSTTKKKTEGTKKSESAPKSQKK